MSNDGEHSFDPLRSVPSPPMWRYLPRHRRIGAATWERPNGETAAWATAAWLTAKWVLFFSPPGVLD